MTAPAEPSEREAFERDAEPLGFDLARCQSMNVEPWDEYVDEATGHRWGGWQAALAAHPVPAGLTEVGWQVRTFHKEGRERGNWTDWRACDEPADLSDYFGHKAEYRKLYAGAIEKALGALSGE